MESKRPPRPVLMETQPYEIGDMVATILVIAFRIPDDIVEVDSTSLAYHHLLYWG